MDIKLTKDAEYLICLLYTAYKERLKEGLSKSDAKLFGGAEYIQSNLIPQYSIDDISETCRELAHVHFLNNFWADNQVYLCNITTDAIVYMENRFINGLTGVLDYIAKIKSVLF